MTAIARPGVILAILCLGGCAEMNPLTREGLWRPVGANETNLRAMVAVPSDLVQGVGTTSSDGNQAARAVDRFRTDRVYALPDNGISKVGRGDGSGTPAPAPAATAQ